MMDLAIAMLVATLLLLGALMILYRYYTFPASPSLSEWGSLTLGHRGCRLSTFNIAENSMISFLFAIEHGADGIELDCALSSDGVLVCMHDNTVNRTCYGEGDVSALTFREINAMKFRECGKNEIENEPVNETESVKRARWNSTDNYVASPANNRIQCGKSWQSSLSLPPSLLTRDENLHGPPSLESIVLLCQHYGVKLMIELKQWTNHRQCIETLMALYQRYPYLYQHSYVASFNPYHLYLVRRYNANVATCLLYCRDVLQWYWIDRSPEMGLPLIVNNRAVRWVCDQYYYYLSPLLVTRWLRPSVIGIHNQCLSLETVEYYHSRGVLVDVWCVNREHEYQHWREQKCLVTTDYLFPKYWNQLKLIGLVNGSGSSGGSVRVNDKGLSVGGDDSDEKESVAGSDSEVKLQTVSHRVRGGSISKVN